MTINTLKYELQDILQGEGKVSYGEPIQAAASYLRESIIAGAETQGVGPNKDKETKKLIEHINTHQLWICDINFNMFIAEGAEQRVFMNPRNTMELN